MQQSMQAHLLQQKGLLSRTLPACMAAVAGVPYMARGGLGADKSGQSFNRSCCKVCQAEYMCTAVTFACTAGTDSAACGTMSAAVHDVQLLSSRCNQACFADPLLCICAQEYANWLSAAMHTGMQLFEQMVEIIKEQVIDDCDAKQKGLLRKLTWQQAQAVSVIAAM